MNDTIYRQEAIEALADYIHNVDKVYSTGKLSTDDCKDAAKSVLDDLPSAQPEIVRCKDCKCFAGEGMYCDWDIMVHYDHFYCYHAERREE